MSYIGCEVTHANYICLRDRRFALKVESTPQTSLSLYSLAQRPSKFVICYHRNAKI